MEIDMQELKTKEAEMLEQLYKNVKMGSDSIVKLLNKVSDGRFKTDLTDQLNGYDLLSRSFLFFDFLLFEYNILTGFFGIL